jgi:hydrophobic/amphiphilic exporter-1 (mainly G- bacteria), HAE1 family
MIRFAIRRPVAVSMAYLAIALLGVAAWRNVPIELLPDTELPRLLIQCTWFGSSPETMESFVTAPIEAAVQQVRGVEKVTSTSQANTSRIEVSFSQDTDMDFARMDLSERLAALRGDLPPRARTQVQPYVPREFEDQTKPFLAYSLTGPYTTEALRAHVDDVIAPELTQVAGVGTVVAYGGRQRLLEIELDEDKVHALGISLQRVAQMVRDLDYVREAGVVETGGSIRTVAIRSRPDDAQDVLNLPLLTNHGRLVRVADVARVHDTFEDAQRYYRIDGMPAVSFVVMKEPGTNVVQVADAVKARLAAIASLHPPGVRLVLDNDESDAVKTQLSDLRLRALIAAVVIFLVLLAFLRSLRSAGIVFATIAFSILITLNLIYWGGFTLNVLTLMGLAMGFGLIVDNAIVVLENIYRHRRDIDLLPSPPSAAGAEAEAEGEASLVSRADLPQGAGPGTAGATSDAGPWPGANAGARAAERGAREVVLPILAATMTTVVVLVPFVYLQGDLQVYYVPLAIVVGFSLIASLFVAFTFIPALASRILGGGGGGNDRRSTADDRRSSGQGGIPVGGPVVGGAVYATSGEGGEAGGGAGTGVPLSPRLPVAPSGSDDGESWVAPSSRAPRRRDPLYVRLYAGLVGFTVKHSIITVLLASLALFGSWHLFDKYVQRGILWGRWWGEDTYLSILITLPRGAELERMDELTRHFEARLREMPEVDRFVSHVQPEYAQIRVTFPDSLEMTNVPPAIKEQMVAYSHLFGGADVRVYGFGPSFYGGGSSPPNYAIKILGYNYEEVRAIADDLGRRLKRFPRIRDVDTNSSGAYYREKDTELVLTLDRPKLALHDLTVRDAVAQVQASVQESAGNTDIRLGGEEVQFAVKLAGNRTMDLLKLQNLLIPTPTGGSVRLGDVATLGERDVLSRVVREDQQYQRYVAYEFRGPVKLGDQVEKSMVDATRLPPGYSLETGNTWQWDVEEQRQIWAVLGMAIALILMVTAALFESLRQPFCVLLTVPMALIGVFLIFFYTGATFTREAYVGVIMMAGIVVNNAILLVDHINHIRREDGLSLQPAIVRGTLERVRPILMTSTTTIFGLLPLVLFSESADSNIWNALTWALIGGLASSTILVLSVTPALYYLFERKPVFRRPAIGWAVRPAMAGGRWVWAHRPFRRA